MRRSEQRQHQTVEGLRVHRVNAERERQRRAGLSPGHRALSHSRYEASIHGDQNERGAYPQLDKGRFASLADAMAWSEVEHRDATLVAVTFFSESRGWQAQHVISRRDGVWA